MVVSNLYYFHSTWGRFPIWLIFFKGVETINSKRLVGWSKSMCEPYFCWLFVQFRAFSSLDNWQNNRHAPWKIVFGRRFSFWNGPFFREHVSFRGVYFVSWILPRCLGEEYQSVSSRALECWADYPMYQSHYCIESFLEAERCGGFWSWCHMTLH